MEQIKSIDQIEDPNHFVYYDHDYEGLIICDRDDRDLDLLDGNYVYDDFIITITTEGKIIGIEIQDATRFFESDFLSRIRKAKISSVREQHHVNLILKFIIDNGETTFEKKIPISELPLEVTA